MGKDLNKKAAQELLYHVAAEFALGRAIFDLEPFGQGNINDTFLVTADNPAEPRFILQRLNTRVFPRPELVMRNLGTFTAHAVKRLADFPLPPGRRWEIPRVLLRENGQDHVIGPDGSFWRALSFIEGVHSRDTLSDPGQAREVGWALGMFHTLISDLPPSSLADTLPGFHVTPVYLKHYDKVAARPALPSPPEANFCRSFIKARRTLAPVLEQAREQGWLKLRPIHGDPKVNNVLFDQASGQAVSLVDLDTIKPGLIHYDLGDCLRSGANPLGEETSAWQEVRFDLDLAKAILTGYVYAARDFLTGQDYAYFFDATRLLAFELGLRFFTDYLAGNVYFKVAHPGHNLARALVQFQLTRSIEAQEEALRALIRELR